MDDRELKQMLSYLVQLGIDAEAVYNTVIPGIKDQVITNRLMTFRDSHQQHVHELNAMLQPLQNGAAKNEYARDFKGYMLQGLAALESKAGTQHALKALQPVEEMIYRQYGESIPLQTPGPVHDMLRRHLFDIKIQLEYIASNLEALSV